MNAEEILDLVIDEVAAERGRQKELMANGKIAFTCASKLATDEDKLRILSSNYGAVLRALVSRDEERSRKELIQLAAVAVGWAESLTEVTT